MDELKFSVVMSVYKNDIPHYFDKAISSVLDQTLVPNEIIIVVDGPISDDLNRVLDQYVTQTNIIKPIRLPENKGLGNALKVGMEISGYDLIARMDSDDLSVPTRFEEQLVYFWNDPYLDIVGGDIAEFIGAENNVVGKRMVPRNDADIRQYMMKRCAFNHVSVMFRKKAVMEAGGYQDWFWNEDYFLWIRMMKKGCLFANTGTVLVNVRVGEQMYQRRGGKKYFVSEYGLQSYMHRNHMITWPRFAINVSQRFVMQMLLPNKVRGFVFKHFARVGKD